MADSSLPHLPLANERLATLARHLIVSLMMACFGYTLAQFVHQLFPDWQGGYLVWVCFFISLEAMITLKAGQGIGPFSREALLYRFTEWVVILLVVKLILYLVHGWDQFLADLVLWQKDFFNNFFSGEFFFVMLIVVMVWALSRTFAEGMARLAISEEQLKLEVESGFAEAREPIRKRLANLIIIIGGTMVVLTTLMRMNWKQFGVDLPSSDAGIINVVLYFILALALLSLTQFSMMRASWGLASIPIGQNMAFRWTIYSALFLVALAVIAILLPTRYSVGLLTLLGYALDAIIILVHLILWLLSIPFIFMLSLLMRLLGKGLPDDTQAQPFSFPPAPQQPGTPISWIETLKSLLFWIVFLGAAGFSLYYYFRQQGGLVAGLGRFRWIAWIANAWSWIRGWLGGVNRQLSAAFDAGRRRLRPPKRSAAPAIPWNFISLRRLSPRQRVLFFYLAMVRRGGEKGLPRKPSQTPYEYAQAMASALKEPPPAGQEEISQVGEDVNLLAQSFVEARYSLHEVTPEHAGLVQRHWERIKRALRNAFQA